MIDVPDELPLPREAFERQRALVSAHVAVSGRRSRRRGALVAVASATVLGVLLVTPAFGIGGRLLELIEGPPAPPEVQTFFAASDETRKMMFAHAQEAGVRLHERFSPVIAGEARGVFAIEPADGPIYLWAAPTEDGRQCWLMQAGTNLATGSPMGLGSCDPSDVTAAMSPETWWTAERPSVEIIHARVYDDAIVRVDVELDGAPAVALPFVAGHAFGTVAKEARVLAIVARDASGDEVTRFTFGQNPD
jgi:hypothetical protein